MAGVKDRATNRVSAAVVDGTDAITLQSFIEDRVVADAQVYTDDHRSYQDMPFFEHESVRHSDGEYVRGEAHTNGIESFWSMLETGAHRHVPQDQPEAHGPLRHGVRRPAQRARPRYCRSNGDYGCRDVGAAATLPRPDLVAPRGSPAKVPPLAYGNHTREFHHVHASISRPSWAALSRTGTQQAHIEGFRKFLISLGYRSRVRRKECGELVNMLRRHSSAKRTAEHRP